MDKIILCSYDKKLMLEKMTAWSVCLDIKTSKDVLLKKQKTFFMWSWIKSFLPNSWWVKVYWRSSLSKRWIMFLNGIWIIDSDYRGEWMIPLYNITNEDINIKKYERIAQVEIFYYYDFENNNNINKEIPKLQIIINDWVYKDFADIYPSARWIWWFWSTNNL